MEARPYGQPDTEQEDSWSYGKTVKPLTSKTAGQLLVMTQKHMLRRNYYLLCVGILQLE